MLFSLECGIVISLSYFEMEYNLQYISLLQLFGSNIIRFFYVAIQMCLKYYDAQSIWYTDTIYKVYALSKWNEAVCDSFLGEAPKWPWNIM